MGGPQPSPPGMRPTADRGWGGQHTAASWTLPWLLMGCASRHPMVASSTIGHQELSPPLVLGSAQFFRAVLHLNVSAPQVSTTAVRACCLCLSLGLGPGWNTWHLDAGMLLSIWKRRKSCTTAQRSPTCAGGYLKAKSIWLGGGTQPPLGLQLAEGGSDLQESLGSIQILGEKRAGLDGKRAKEERNLVTSSARAAGGRTPSPRECAPRDGTAQGLHTAVPVCSSREGLPA